MGKIFQTKNLKFLRKSTKDILLLEGSSRSSKTFSVLQFLCLLALDNPKWVIRAFRFDAATCELSIISDLRIILFINFPNVKVKENKTEKSFLFPNGSKIIFGGTSDPMKLHGPAQNVAYFNEVMEHHLEAWDQVCMRTTDLIIADWNPSLNHHWIFDIVMKQDSDLWEYCHSTYIDNPFLTPKQIREIEKFNPSIPANVKGGTADTFMWAVYGKGERGAKEGRIFRNWEIRPDKAFPLKRYCDRWGYGMDFGFSSDPSTLILCAIHQNALWVHEMVYEQGLIAGRSASNPDWPSVEGRMDGLQVNKHTRIWADSARPDLINELYLAGYNIHGAKKDKGSILAGVNILQGLKIYITRSSMGIVKEFEQYCWDRKRDGTWLDTPIDDYNHAIDAIRYFALMEIKKESNRENKGSYKAKGGGKSRPKTKKARGGKTHI